MPTSLDDAAAGPDDRALTLGVDLGGTKILTVLVAGDGRVLASRRRKTHPSRGFEGVVADIVSCARDCLLAVAPAPPAAIGIGVAGQVEEGSGVVSLAPNLEWEDVPLRAAVERELNIPTMVTNDVRAAAWGEWRFGAGRGVEDLVVLFVGTGVGGAVVSAGRMLTGCGNSGGELGHLTLVAGGRKCRCPNHGCLEAYVGGWAIAERAREAVLHDPAAGAGLRARAGSVEGISAATVTEAYREGDALAGRLVEETADYLAAGLVGIVNAFNPCVVVLGGGVIDRVPEYVDRVRPQVMRCALPAAARGLRIEPARLGGEAGAVGAAEFARASLGIASPGGAPRDGSHVLGAGGGE